MKKNIGIIDKTVRVLVAAAIIALYFTKAVSGTTVTILLSISVIFIATSIMGFCPLYLPFGISTNKKNKSATKNASYSH